MPFGIGHCLRRADLVGTAKALGISRATLYRRVQQPGIQMPGCSPA